LVLLYYHASMIQKNLYEINDQIAQFMTFFSDNGGYIVASKDWHPQDHCSFGPPNPPCLNNDSFSSQTYQNDFPPHCVHNTSTGVPLTETGGFRGADFVPEIAEVLQKLVPNNLAQIVFKGFNNSYDSFSAFSMDGGSAQELEYTGGYALTRPIGQEKIDNYYPTVQEMIYPETYMLTTTQILKQKGINKLFVCGLVFDYCVRDTAVYALNPQNMGDVAGIEVFVLSDLTRPAMDGSTQLVPNGFFFLGSNERILSSAGIILNTGAFFLKSEQIVRKS